MEFVIRRNGINTVNSLINMIINAGSFVPTTWNRISEYLEGLEARYPGDAEIISLRNQLNNI